MKFFIAAPWRSKDIVEGLVAALGERGYQTYSFLENGANLLTGASVVDELKQFADALKEWQGNQGIKTIFDSELAGLKESDVILMLEPAGHSSLIEAGIGYGLGKRVIIIGEVEKPEVFYLIAEKLYPDIPTFLNDLANIAPNA